MLVTNIPVENLPQVNLSDKVEYVLQLMHQYRLQDLVVVNDDVFLGIIKEEALLGINEETATIKDLQHYLLKVSVNPADHLLHAISVAGAFHLSAIPVVDSHEKLAGIIKTGHLITEISNFMQLGEPGALIVLEVDAKQYSFSEICRLVESNDAQITQLNTLRNAETGAVQITLKLNKQEVSDIIATFQRYEYHVKYYFGEELYANELKNNYENLMSYLNV